MADAGGSCTGLAFCHRCPPFFAVARSAAKLFDRPAYDRWCRNCFMPRRRTARPGLP
jgi:hypothetical protein